MSKNPLALLCALLAAGLLAFAGALYIADPNRSALHLPTFGKDRSVSEIFLPLAPQPEARIVRHREADGNYVDDVIMRDGTTKRIVYDSRLMLLTVDAFYKGDKTHPVGPLMYQKTHNAQGHLSTERHLRQDGSLEMDGFFRPDGTFVRHHYYPSAATPAVPVQDPRLLSVSTEQVFDAAWHPVREVDLRQDGTRQLLHTWTGLSQDLVTTYGADGQTILSSEGKKGGAYLSVTYFPDGQTIQSELTKDSQGTNVTLYRQDAAHSVALMVTYDVNGNDIITLMDAAGKPRYRQDWAVDFSGQPYPGPEPRKLDHIDHLTDSGLVDIRYEYYRKSGKLMTVTFFTGGKGERFGARTVYNFAEDGSTAKVETFDDKNNSVGGAKDIPPSTASRFALDPRVGTRPQFTAPTLKDGLKLYGEPPHDDFDF
jgi:hypothetical protein